MIPKTAFNHLPSDLDSSLHVRFAAAVHVLAEFDSPVRDADGKVYNLLRSSELRRRRLDEDARLPAEPHEDRRTLDDLRASFQRTVYQVASCLQPDGALVVHDPHCGRVVLTSVRKIADHLSQSDPFVLHNHVIAARELLRAEV